MILHESPVRADKRQDIINRVMGHGPRAVNEKPLLAERARRGSFKNRLAQKKSA
jgi:hypothetical protein